MKRRRKFNEIDLSYIIFKFHMGLYILILDFLIYQGVLYEIETLETYFMINAAKIYQRVVINKLIQIEIMFLSCLKFAKRNR